MEKELVHTIDIMKVGHRVLFQIPLPEAAREITGIDVSVFPASVRPVEPNNHYGELRLAVPREGDVFYAERIRGYTESPAYADLFLNIDYLPRSPWFYGTKRKPYKLYLPVETTFIEGYYEDTANAPGIGGVLYSLRIYLYYNKREKQ